MAEAKQYDPVLALRIPADVLAVIERQAKESERTISGQARWLLASAIAAQAKQQTGRAA